MFVGLLKCLKSSLERNSRALGYLVVYYIHRMHYRPRCLPTQPETTVSAPTANVSIHGVPKGSHTVLVFDGEQYGLLSARAAAVQTVSITEGEPQLQELCLLYAKFVDCKPE